MAGPNGSGKTTLIQRLRERGVGLGEYINPDDIAGELEGLYDARVAEAQSIADRRREACIEAKRSFSFETVMSHPSKIDVLVRAKAAGFIVQLFFVGTDDPNTSVERVALRVVQGGHDVPRDRIIARWHRTMGFLHQAIKAADQAFVFDNSAAGHVDIGPRLVLLCRSTQEATPSKVAGIEIRQFPPIPDWVRQYALYPLNPAGHEGR